MFTAPGRCSSSYSSRGSTSTSCAPRSSHRFNPCRSMLSGIRALLAGGLHGQAGGTPSLKAAHEVGRTGQSQLLQGGRREARLVALVAEDDQLPVGIGHALIAPRRGGVTAPL